MNGKIGSKSYYYIRAAADPVKLAEFISTGTRTEITQTFYDSAPMPALQQTNLRNRIAAITYSYNLNPSYYTATTHYSYDIHGNVKQLIQNIPSLQLWRRDTIRIDYDYDLLSGNINRVTYQRGKPEQWQQRYRYDADNRLTHAYSNYSQYALLNPRLGERLEARYFYYPHGALARTETGHKALQGTDYACKLQGWLKAINGIDDMGLDAAPDNPNAVFAQDAFNSIFYYYERDYTPINGINYSYWNYRYINSLYDGNITALSTGGTYSPMLKDFKYDKINRIKAMNTAEYNTAIGNAK